MFNSLKNLSRPKNEFITLKSYSKQDNVAPPPYHNIILNFVQYLSDFKSTIFLP